MKSLFSRLSVFPAVAIGALLGSILFAGLSHPAQGQSTAIASTPAAKTASPNYLRVHLEDSFTQELRLDSDVPVRVATKLRDTDYVISAEPRKLQDGSFLVMIRIKKIMHGTVAGKPFAAEQSAQTSQLLKPDGSEHVIASFRSAASGSGAAVTRTTASLHTEPMF